MRLAQPLRLGPLEVRNRLVFPAHLTNAAVDGLPTAQHAAYYGPRAAGGAGLVITEEQSVDPDDRPYEKLVRGTDPAVVPGYRAIADAVHARGAVVLAQIGHHGGQASGRYSCNPVDAPSDVVDPMFREVPRTLSTDRIAALVAGFARVAGHVVAGGLDGVEVQASQASLIRQFLSPRVNHRTDAYCRDPARLLVEVLTAVRDVLGPGQVLGVRLQGDEGLAGGLTARDAAAAAVRVERLVDFVNTSVGIATATLPLIEPPMGVPAGYASAVPSAVRAAVAIPVVGVPTWWRGRRGRPRRAPARSGWTSTTSTTRGLDVTLDRERWRRRAHALGITELTDRVVLAARGGPGPSVLLRVPDHPVAATVDLAADWVVTVAPPTPRAELAEHLAAAPPRSARAPRRRRPRPAPRPRRRGGGPPDRRGPLRDVDVGRPPRCTRPARSSPAKVGGVEIASARASQCADLPVLLVPVGATEQHGPHLPLGTDTAIAVTVAGRSGLPVGPPLPYGASGEHETFPGTVSIGTEALAAVLVELGRSACRFARRLVLVNGHGGNVVALRAAVALLRGEGRDVAWFPCGVPGADAHAGRHETSVMLALAPGDVRADLAVPGNTAPLAELLPAITAGSVRDVSPSGVLGDPIGADAGEGAESVSMMVAALRAAVEHWSVDEASGRLR